MKTDYTAYQLEQMSTEKLNELKRELSNSIKAGSENARIEKNLYWIISDIVKERKGELCHGW